MTTSPEQAFTSDSFDKFLKEKKLMGSHCPHCYADYLPPRPICPQCFGDQLEWKEFKGKAKLAAFTAIYIAPTKMIEAGYGRNDPYLVGIVELDEGVKIIGSNLGIRSPKRR